MAQLGSTKIFGDLTVTGTVTGTVNGDHVKATGTGNDYHTGGFETIGNGSSNTVFPTYGFHQPGLFANSLQARSGSDIRAYKQGATSYADFYVANLYATGNVTAYYSDARLKDFIKTIENPLEKVLKLNGYYYKPNAKAIELGYNDTEIQVGVSAQEVQLVLPEIISEAAINSLNEDSADRYLTVDYSRITPLLIEAIKEQQKQIEELKLEVAKYGTTG